MIKIGKAFYLTICVVVAIVAVTLCVNAIISGNDEALVHNIVLIITTFVGLIVKVDDDDSDDSSKNKGDLKNDDDDDDDVIF